MSQNAFNPSRRQLFRGDTSSKRLPIRLPWSLPETDFIRDCSRCGDCIAQCPEAILIKGSGGFPEVDFQRGECSFCGDCVASCSAAVFKSIDTAPWIHTAAIGEGCITHQQVVCRSCVEQCEPEAISLTMQPGGIGIPSIDTSQCNGCGACVAVCPTQAISMSLNPTAHQTANNA
ncbi:MAG: ferredoxin-type protein NapF [Motiliproteus sp.]|jgi:ferredoxin-type protein NapF